MEFKSLDLYRPRLQRDSGAGGDPGERGVGYRGHLGCRKAEGQN